MFDDLNLFVWGMVGALPATAILAAFRSLRPAPSNRPSARVSWLLRRGVDSLVRHWKMALTLLVGATCTVLVGLYFAEGAFVGIVGFIVGVILIFTWHRENLSDAMDLAMTHRPSGNVFGLIIRSFFVGIVGVAVAIIPLMIFSSGQSYTSLVWGDFQQPLWELGWPNFSITLAVFVFVLSSVWMARWVLMIPAAAVGDSLNYDKAMVISRGMAPPLTAALMIVFLITESFQRIIDLAWTWFDTNYSVPEYQDLPFGAVWYDFAIYSVPTEILTIIHILICVGIVSAAFEKVRVPQILVEQIEKTNLKTDQPAPFD